MKRKKQPQIPKTKKLTKQSFNKEKGITLIALVITIIVLIILAGISINSVLGGNGLFKRVQSASVDTKKAKVIEDAKIAYLEVYIEKAEKSDSNTITIGDVVSRLKSGYGYTDEQIVMVSSVVTDITLSETEVTLKPGETKDVIVTLENGTYYALIEGLYYPITLSNDGITLGEGIANLPEGEETTDTIEAKATLGSDLVDVIVNETTITITAKEGQAGKVTIIVTYGGIKKEIIATIIWEVKQGDEVPLGSVSVMVNGIQRTLDQGWKYFYNDEDSGKVWLIYSEIIEGVAQQISGTISILGNGVYSYSSRQDLIDYLNGTGNYKGSWDHIKIGIITALSAKKITIGEDQIEVKGSPDIQLFQKAYNQMYPNENFEMQENNTGWRFRFGGTGDFANYVSVNNYLNKPLFFEGHNSWLTDSSDNMGPYLCSVYYIGQFIYQKFNEKALGARPVVSIPKSVFDQLVGN